MLLECCLVNQHLMQDRVYQDTLIAVVAGAVLAPLLLAGDIEAGKVGHVHSTKHSLGVLIDLDALLDLEVNLGDVWDVIQATLTLFLLQHRRVKSARCDQVCYVCSDEDREGVTWSLREMPRTGPREILFIK